MVKKQIIKNFVSAWLSKLIKLVSAIYMVPVFINSMGKDSYGLIILLTTILSFSVLADIGIRSGVTRHMARSIALKEYSAFNKVFNTGLGIYLVIWIILSVILFFSTEAIVEIFNVPPILVKDCVLLLRTYGIFSLFWSFTTPLFSAVSSASNRFDLANYRESIIGLFSLIALIFAVKFFHIGVVGWALITVITQLITALAVIKIAFNLSPYLKISLFYFDKSIIKELVKFGGITLIGGWSRKMKIDADPLLISSILGPGSIAVYRSGVSIPGQSRNLLNSFTGQITSVSTNLYAVGDSRRFTQLFERGTRLTLFMGIPVLVMLVVFAFDIIELWLGKTFSAREIINSSRCLQGMALVDFCFYLEGSSYAILYGMNRLKFMTFTDLILGILNIVSSYLVLKYSGLDIWVVILPTVFIEGIARPFYLYYTAKQIDYPPAFVFSKIYFPTLVVLLPTLIAAIVCNLYLPMSGFAKLIVECFITGAVYVPTLWYLGFSASDKSDIIAVFSRKRG